MAVIGTILWILCVCWLLGLAVPSDFMRRDRTGNGVYYSLWVAITGVILAIHYQVLTHVGYGLQALLTDGVALMLFLLGRLGFSYIRRGRGAVDSICRSPEHIMDAECLSIEHIIPRPSQNLHSA